MKTDYTIKVKSIADLVKQLYGLDKVTDLTVKRSSISLYGMQDLSDEDGCDIREYLLLFKGRRAIGQLRRFMKDHGGITAEEAIRQLTEKVISQIDLKWVTF